MSEIFQAVLFRGAPADLEGIVGVQPTGTLMLGLPGGVVAVSPPLPEDRELDALSGGTLAMRISQATGVALHVMYDSRIGFRHSQVFRRGTPTAVAFGSSTERWHRLDAAGAPILGETLTADELVDGEEYETSVDAIAQGLNASGFDLSTSQLVQAVCYGGGS